MKFRHISCEIILLISVFATDLFAFQDARWSGPTNGESTSSYFIDANWQGLQVPANTAFFGTDATMVPGGIHTVYFGDFSPLAGGEITHGGTAKLLDGTFIEGGDFVFNFDSFKVADGNSGALSSPELRLGFPNPKTGLDQNAMLTVTGNGTFETANVVVGGTFANGSNGILIVESENTVLDVADQFDVIKADSSFIVRQGATVNIGTQLGTSDGNAVISGESTLVSINQLAANTAGVVCFSGAITVSDNAGLFTSGAVLLFGQSSGSLIDIDNGNLLATNIVLIDSINQAEGVVTIRNGGCLNNTSTFVNDNVVTSCGVGWNFNSAGSVAISDPGSEWVQGGAMVIGRLGIGTLTVSQSGYLECQSGFIGREFSSTGVAEVFNGGRWHVVDSMYVGGSLTGRKGGVAELLVSELGEVGIGQQLKIYEDGLVDAAENGKIQIGQPVSTTPPGTVHVGPNGTLSGDGTVSADVWNEGGLIAPGCPTGQLVIDGDLMLGPDAKTFIEVAGTNNIDNITINGTFTANGELTIAFVDGFSPSMGDVFEILDASMGLNSEFQSIRIAGLQEGFEFETIANGTVLELVALNDGTALLLGDINRDGNVDLLDVGPFINVLISGIFQAEADINLDGIVDLLDVAPFVSALTGG